MALMFLALAFYIQNLSASVPLFAFTALLLILVLIGRKRTESERDSKLGAIGKLIGSVHALMSQRAEGSGGLPEPAWSIGWKTSCAIMDVKVRDGFALDRYAIAYDVGITNDGDVPVSISASLLMNYGAVGPHPVCPLKRALGAPINHWDGLLRAFSISSAPQLLFPLNLSPRSSAQGHIAFSIEEIGCGASEDDADEYGPTERAYWLEFSEAVTLETQTIGCDSVYAPRIDGLGLVNHTDLATAGNPSLWIARQEVMATDALDVTLEGTYPNAFTLRARGNVREIRTGPLVIESAVVGTKKDGEWTIREVSPRYTIEFPVVGSIRDGEEPVVQASLLCGEGYSRGAWPEKESGRTGLAEFFRWAERLRRVKIGEPDVNTCTEAEMDDFARQIRQELTFCFDISFWNYEHTDPWKRSEVLVYEPETGRAYARPVGKPERLVASTEVRP
ncbi:MAG TPA: hypothetical protein VGR95_20745 [Thermoanaerobaculia bacterium]|nr:hypothetical protein [Thermoanaerobaculia bacterium]